MAQLTASDSPGASKSLIDYQRSYGTHWTNENMDTLYEWITISSFNIECLDQSARYHRSIIRNSTIFGLIFSTLSGTLGVSQFSITNPLATQIINGFFVLFTFTIALYTGYIKVYQIQERLEQFIKFKQDWTVFSTSLASELQLPIELRHDALYIITKNKTIYLNLLKTDCEIPKFIEVAARAKISHNRGVREMDLDVSSLPDIMIDICRKNMEESKRPLLSEHRSSPNMVVLPIN
jgi:hypothetical protein